MANDGVDLGRRRMLTGATVVLGAIGAGYVAVPFIGSWQPSARTKAAGAPIEVDISKIDPGMMIRANWRGQPIFFLRRTKEQLDGLKTMTTSGALKDPDSELLSQQPSYTHNEFRSIKPEYMIMIGICTHLGCVPSYKPESGSLTPGLPGGYFCPCHGSKFDNAGRVYNGVPAQKNLVIPPHFYVKDTLVRVGEDKGEA
ncbi:MAG TPA: ubiquinol-cytochrome c reductase iron-sulfur subunit [Aeromonadales bacterium]|nr:ubiquinol-cytochrome c reductase iron-sulfur subunit [Aeromonadales bacterium]